MIKLYLILAIVLFIALFAYFTIKKLNRLTMFQLTTAVDFVQLTQGQQIQDTQLPAIAQVEQELIAKVQPALDMYNESLVVLAADQQAIAEAQAILDAANAKLVTDQAISDALLATYNFIATDLVAWQAAQFDISNDAQTVATLQDIYVRNGGIA